MAQVAHDPRPRRPCEGDGECRSDAARRGGRDGPGARGRIPDTRRIEFHRGFLQALHQAIEYGADVRSYHAWSLLDNFEWAEGYSQRFGLAWVDFETGERTLKDSGLWYGQVAQENGFEAR